MPVVQVYKSGVSTRRGDRLGTGTSDEHHDSYAGCPRV